MFGIPKNRYLIKIILDKMFKTRYISNMKKISKSKLISLLIELNQIDEKLYKLTNPYERYPEQREGWFFLSYYNVLNMIYYEFYGQSHEECYKSFKSCYYDAENKPIAWYKGVFSIKNDGSIKGPKGHSGFIPDSIDNVILDYKLTAKEKLNLLNRMFKDLKK